MPGLHLSDPLPVPDSVLAGATLVADVVTDPVRTPRLIAAETAGAQIVTGEDMLEGQWRLLYDFIRSSEA